MAMRCRIWRPLPGFPAWAKAMALSRRRSCMYRTQTQIRFRAPQRISNGDHKSDLVLCALHANPSGDNVRILLGTTAMTLQPALREIVGWQPFAGVAADFDGDGQPDVAVLNGYSRTASVLLNKPAVEASLSRAVLAASGSARVAPGLIATLYVQTGAVAAVQAGDRGPPPSAA